MGDLGELTPAAVLAVWYVIGLTRLRAPEPGTPEPVDEGESIGPGPTAAGFAALVTMAVALGPPLDGWTTNDLAAHMVQHVLLLAIVAPLLVVGEAPRVLFAALSGRARRRVERATSVVAPTLRRVPVVAWITLGIGGQTLALGLWHLPVLYDAAVTHPLVHAAEHASFLLAGFFFWWTVSGAGRRAGRAAAVIAIFVASLPGTMLGAFMTLSTGTWYPLYSTGSFAHALQNQQLAGVVMWAGGGMAYVASGAALFVGWLRELERISPSRVTAGAAS